MKKLALLFAIAIALPLHAAGYHVARHIVVGGTGGWDYPAVDEELGLLFLSHGDFVDVVNIATGRKTATIDGLAGVHGIALAADLHRGYISNGRAGTVTVFELPSLKKIAEWRATGDNPDAILYDKASQRVFTFNGRGRNITEFDAKSGAVVATIPVYAKPEFAVSRGNGIVYVNLEDKGEIAEIDASKGKLVRTWSIVPCESPSGLAMDTKNARLFSVCGNQLMAVSDADAGRILTTVPIGQGPDGAAFDPAKNLAFSSNGRDGTLTVVEEVTPDKFRVVETVDTARGARTIILDTRSHHLYLPTANFGPPPAATIENPRPRPTIEPGSFEAVDVAP